MSLGLQLIDGSVASFTKPSLKRTILKFILIKPILILLRSSFELMSKGAPLFVEKFGKTVE